MTTATLSTVPDVSLRTRARLGVLKRKVWGTGTKKDDEITAEVAEQKKMSAGAGQYRKAVAGDLKTKGLSPAKKALKDIVTISTEAYAYYKSITSPWLNNGTRIFSIDAYWTVTTKMRDYEESFTDAVKAFVPHYPQLLREIEQDQGEAFKRSEYPRPNEIESYFGIGFSSYAMPDTQQENDFRSKLGDVEVEKIMRQNEADMNAAFQNAMRDVYSRVFTVVGRMAERLRLYNVDPKGGVEHPFRDSLVENVRELAELLPLLNVTGDAMLAQIARDVEDKLTRYTAESLRASDSKREEVRKAAEEIAARCQAETEAISAQLSEFIA